MESGESWAPSLQNKEHSKLFRDELPQNKDALPFSNWCVPAAPASPPPSPATLTTYTDKWKKSKGHGVENPDSLR